MLRDFSFSSKPSCLEKDHLALPIGKNAENLREFSFETKQNKPGIQVIRALNSKKF
jgi:hypothetical protein